MNALDVCMKYPCPYDVCCELPNMDDYTTVRNTIDRVVGCHGITCYDCWHIMKGEEKLTLKDREWVCLVCGSYHIRDINAAINILNKGLIA